MTHSHTQSKKKNSNNILYKGVNMSQPLSKEKATSDKSEKKIPLLEEVKKIKEYVHGFDNDKNFVCMEKALFDNFTPSTITNLFESGQIIRNPTTGGVEWND